jgi:hypothetical protein
MRGAGSAGGSTTSGAGCFSNTQNKFTRRAESVANRSYIEGLFCSFEQLSICDGLSATEQAC